MKIALAQIAPIVGAFQANGEKISEAYKKAIKLGADLVITPELSICGYPPHDLIDRPEIFDRCGKVLEDLAKLTSGSKTALVVGWVGKSREKSGRPAQNFVSVLSEGKEVFRQAKTLLPTYDVFDEARYFEPASQIELFTFQGKKIALAICEDLWSEDPTFGRRLYGRNPIEDYQKKGAELVISVSASPFEQGKWKRREKLHREVSDKLGVPLIYVNQVGATDEILFDGESFAYENSTKEFLRLDDFSEQLEVLEWNQKLIIPKAKKASPPEDEVLVRALITGIREYFQRTGFTRAIVGVSGGIDSAVIAVLASQAIGAKNVLGVAMPGPFSQTMSYEDAEKLCRNLGMGFEVRPIKFLNSQFSRELSEKRGTLADLAQENLQSRIRGNILMTISNHENALVLTTGNKSELATGYCTMYGDMVGAIAPIGDLYKTEVFELAKTLNRIFGNPIPERTITRPPSAELRANQTDQDSLPPYEDLDRVLRAYLEVRESADEIAKREGEWVKKVLSLVERNEYKRRQAAPVLKVSSKAFGIGRRLPVAKKW